MQGSGGLAIPPAVGVVPAGKLGVPFTGVVPAGKLGVPFRAGLVDGILAGEVVPGADGVVVPVVKVVELLVPDVGAVQLKLGMPGRPAMPGVVPAFGDVSVGDVSARAAVGSPISKAPIALASAARRGRAVMGHLLLALLGEGERRVAACPAHLKRAQAVTLTTGFLVRPEPRHFAR